MNADADIRKFSQLVLADTSLQRGLKEGLVVDMSLLVPQKKLQGSGAESLGGFMGVPLRELRLGKGSRPFSVDEFLGQEAVKRNEEVILVLDTGSQGFWVMDMTQGADGANLLEKATLGTQVGDYELVLGDRGGSTFTLTIPQQWRDFEGGAELLKEPPSFVKNQGLQCLIVGNPFLQAVAITFAPSQSPPKAYFSHLDARGRRCPAYAGPKSDVRAPPQGSFVSLTGQQHVRSGKIPLKDGRLHISSLVETSLATAAPPSASTQKAKDVTLDLRFMKFPVNSKQSRGAQTISVESSSARDLVVPCLDVLMKDAAGNQVYNTHIFDTGSGVNLSLDVDLDPATTRSCEGAACYCASPGKVGDVFAKSIASNAAGGSRCKKCSRPMLEAKQGGGLGICNTSCCTSEGVSCDDQMPCSVVFCTGVVSYSPCFAQMSFPSEVSQKAQKRHLQDVPRVFVGKAQAACVPGVQSGLFGAWYWDSPLKPPGKGSAAALEASGLPYYLLEHIGQIATPDENYTLKFWRTDLNTAKKSLIVGADASARPGPVPSSPWWDKASPPPEPSPLPAPEPSPPPAPEPSPPPAPEPSPPPAPEPSPPPAPEPSPPPSPEPSPPPSVPPSPDAPPDVPPPRPCPTGPCPSGALQRLDGMGDNSNGKQQIVIVAPPSGGGGPVLPLTGVGGGEPDKGGRKRDWVVVGLSIAAVALLFVLLVVSIRQSSSYSI